MNITVLTSSRADFGIQLPLLRALENDPTMRLSLIAFGSHADPRYGHTLDEIIAQGFTPSRVLPPALEEDDAAGVSAAMGRTMEQFAGVWRDHPVDTIVALGDRYEMFAAVAAAMPFGIRVAHLHGGETTLGAIDNAFRHSLTHMARLHFTAAEPYRQRVWQLTGGDAGVFNTGALGIDNIRTMHLLDAAAIRQLHGIDLSRPTVLVTVHPETVNTGDADMHWDVMETVLRELAGNLQVLVTLPNADTGGNVLRERMRGLGRSLAGMQAVDSLGALGYLSCINLCTFMLGNSSSGYVEASFFNKRVIDIGERQTGRIVTPNIIRTPFQREMIMHAVHRALNEPMVHSGHPYGDGHAAERMMAHLRNSG
jgi:GDP/UDP-N,N'-diacetylbacillosamine 2-epimerase (hydrolysing)